MVVAFVLSGAHTIYTQNFALVGSKPHTDRPTDRTQHHTEANGRNEYLVCSRCIFPFFFLETSSGVRLGGLVL
jgi:hypothetical protein